MVEIRDSQDDVFANFEFYYYTPSLGAAVLFIVLFTGTTGLHLYQMIRTRTWFLIPFCIGGIFEIIGYCGRAASSTQAPDFTTGPFTIQSIFLLIAPALLAASIYMELARIVLMVEGDNALFIKRTWLTRLFVSGDVLSFLFQASGGGLLASSSGAKTGERLVMVGLALQLIFFFLFVLAASIFHFRIRRDLTTKSRSLPWKKHMWSLYIVSVLIFVRSLVRLIEYAQGWSGYILSHEVFLYVFDSLLMFIAMITMNWIHPSEVAALVYSRGLMVTKLVRTKKPSSMSEVLQLNESS